MEDESIVGRTAQKHEGEMYPDQIADPFSVYKDARGEWRWRLVAKNGQIVGGSGEGYATMTGAHKAVQNVKKLVGGS